MFEEKIES
jgi:hypothetical protein